MRKTDRQVVLTLLCVIIVALAVIFFSDSSNPKQPQTKATVDSSKVGNEDSTHHGPYSSTTSYYQQPERKVERFAFDPNTADSTQLLRLGLQPWQVRSIYKYRASGGIYRNKEDFARLYGLTVKQYRELEPYITISSDYQPASTLVGKRHHADNGMRDTLLYDSPRKIAPGEHVDLNILDTAAYRTVPGIGSYYARKILDYGRRLGGYTSVDQLDEIDGFPQTAKAFFTVAGSDSLQHVCINRLSLNELKRHPYINYYQAKAIVDYRRQTGPIHSLDELRLLRDFPQEAIGRLRPYICYDE